MLYGDVETLLCTWLKATLQVGEVVPELPYNTAFVLPLIAVERFGGGDDTVSIDRCHLDVDVFHIDRPSAKLLAEQVRRALRMVLPGLVIGDNTTGRVTVSRVETIAAPSIAAWDNARLRRFTAAYRLTLHAPL